MVLIRYGVYFGGIAALMVLLAWVEIATPGSLKLHVLESPGDVFGTSEYSPVELMQPAFLAFCVLLCAWVARDCPGQRPLAFALGGLALAFAIRELHFFFDRFVVDNFWQVLAAIILALLIVYLYRNRRRFHVAWLRLWPSPGLTLLFAGAVVQFIVAQMIGHEPLWRALLGDDYQRIAKLAAEEFTELLGYCLWLIGTLEYAYEARAISLREPV